MTSHILKEIIFLFRESFNNFNDSLSSFKIAVSISCIFDIPNFFFIKLISSFVKLLYFFGGSYILNTYIFYII